MAGRLGIVQPLQRTKPIISSPLTQSHPSSLNLFLAYPLANRTAFSPADTRSPGRILPSLTVKPIVARADPDFLRCFRSFNKPQKGLPAPLVEDVP